MSIAIDGPSGAGKSTVAKALAKRLKIPYVDTGAMYRAIAYAYLEGGRPEDLEKFLKTMPLKISPEGIYYKGKLLDKELRTSEVTMLSSSLSKEAPVRQYLLEDQRRLGQDHNVVMEGRDIGTVVLKDAAFKFFLTADVDLRAKRRHEQNIEKGLESNLEEVKEDLLKRDQQDLHREIAPLKQARDAILIDSSHLTLEETVEKMAQYVEEGQ